MFETYSRLAERALAGQAPSREDARWILGGKDVEFLPLLHAAFVPRRHHFGREVMVHVLNNVQNGLCPEDCGYCSQNKDSEAPIREYPMKSDEEIFAEAEHAAQLGASRYCMVLSGRGPGLARTRRLAELIRSLKERYELEVCLSAGLVGDEHARILGEAGLDRLNHNLNTSERLYPEVCSTHTFSDRVATIEAAHKHGIGTCSGLIVGMGEGDDDIIDLAFQLRDLEVPSIPVNFLIPIEGNQIQEAGTLTPERCLRVLCLMRFANPSAEIRVAAGREGNFRGLQALSLYPANSLFVEGYLTTRGDDAEKTYRMIADAGFEIAGDPLVLEGGSVEMGDVRFQIPGGGDELLRPEVLRD